MRYEQRQTRDTEQQGERERERREKTMKKGTSNFFIREGVEKRNNKRTN